jgi:hypothetical protein
VLLLATIFSLPVLLIAYMIDKRRRIKGSAMTAAKSSKRFVRHIWYDE